MTGDKVKQNRAARPKPKRAPRPSRPKPGYSPHEIFVIATDPIAVPAVAKQDYAAFASILGPNMTFSDATDTNPFRAFIRNYVKYRVHRLEVKLISLASSTAVMGYDLSLNFSPDPTESLTSLQPTNLRQLGPDHVTVPPGSHRSMNIRVKSADYFVDPTDKPAAESFPGQFFAVVHGTPIAAFTNSAYTGPLFRLEFIFTIEAITYSPGNIADTLPQSGTTETLTLSADEGNATLNAPSAFFLASSLGDIVSEKNKLGDTVYQIALNAADSVTGVLPFPFNVLGKVGLFFVRKVFGSNGEVFYVYKDFNAAVNNRPVKSSQHIPLGTSRMHVSAVATVSAPTPFNPGTLDLTKLVTGRAYTLEMAIDGPDGSTGGNFPTQPVRFISLTDNVTGEKTSSTFVLANVRIDGRPLTLKTVYGNTGAADLFVMNFSRVISYGFSGGALDSGSVIRLLATSATPQQPPIGHYSAVLTFKSQ